MKTEMEKWRDLAGIWERKSILVYHLFTRHHSKFHCLYRKFVLANLLTFIGRIYRNGYGLDNATQRLYNHVADEIYIEVFGKLKFKRLPPEIKNHITPKELTKEVSPKMSLKKATRMINKLGFYKICPRVVCCRECEAYDMKSKVNQLGD